MKPNPKKPTKTCLIKFQKDFNNLEDLRTEISSCLITKDNLWVSYDEDAGLERLTLKKSGNKKIKFSKHKHYEIAEFFDLPGDTEMDMEALAYAEPYLWFCGSMSLKRDSPAADDDVEEQLKALETISLDENRFSLGCIPCIEKNGTFELHKEYEFLGHTITAKMMRGGTKSSELHNALLLDEHLADYMRIPSKDNGFDIEGLAVEGDRIFIGLRGPVLNGYAVILEITCDSINNELIMLQREGEDKLYRKHFIDLAGMGIRELNIDKRGDLYLLAGPTMDLDGTIAVYKIEGGLTNAYASVVHEPKRLFDAARGRELEHGVDKAEGMAFISEKEVLITYDNPHKNRLKGKRKVIMDIYNL